MDEKVDTNPQEEMIEDQVDSIMIIENNNSSEMQLDSPQSNVLKRFFIWFCGIQQTESSTDERDNGKSSQPKEQNKLTIDVSMEQDYQARVFLLTALFIIICLALFIFIFFSIPNWWVLVF